jgi:hypothetical protein
MTPLLKLKILSFIQKFKTHPSVSQAMALGSGSGFSLRKILVTSVVLFLIWTVLREVEVVRSRSSASSGTGVSLEYRLTLANTTCPAACATLQNLRPATPAAPSRLDLSLRRRFIDGMLSLNGNGLATFTNDGVAATWVPMNGFIVAMLSHYQRQWGIHGAAGEIGVHWADYFLPIAITAREDELLWVLDVFEQQEKNIDKSGNGDYNIFMSRYSGGTVAVLKKLMYNK